MTCSSAGIVANEVRDGHLLPRVQGDRVPTKASPGAAAKTWMPGPRPGMTMINSDVVLRRSANDYRRLQQSHHASHSGRVSRGSAPASESRNPVIEESQTFRAEETACRSSQASTN